MTVRVFGGWDFSGRDLNPDWVKTGYSRGVPMGGQMKSAPTTAARPSFLISALKDPQGANLDRVQVIKGWIDAGGATHEKVFDVAWSDPEFDPRVRAFYYLRVIEIPTPTWVAFDALRYHLKLPPEVPMKSQERAYTSPIWYNPPA
jgi:hypothetical protein